MNERGRLIVVEGIDGAGSSTQCQRLLEFVRSHVAKAILTKEPTDGPAGAMLRLALSHRLNGPNTKPEPELEREPASAELDPRTMALLFAADRLDHTTGLIEPMLVSGVTVVCDRYLLSSLAYQGLRVDHQWILSINRHVPVPDATIYLSTTVHHTQHRMKTTRPGLELYETPTKQQEIEESYRRAINAKYDLVGPVYVVPAIDNAAAVAKRIREIVRPLFPDGRPKARDGGTRGPTLFEAGAP